jgi:hypothetical protein
MTEAQMRELVSATFATGWPAIAPTVPFSLESEGAAIPPPDSEFFAYLSIQPTSSVQLTTGKRGVRKVRRNLWIQVKLWGPADQGSAAIAELSDKVADLLEMVSLTSPTAGDDPVVTQAAQSGPSGADTDGRWFMSVTRIPGWYMEVK